MDLLKKSVNSLTVLGLYAGTPIDSDNLHQFIGGLSKENMEAALSPVSIAWTLSSSIFKISYERLENIILVIFKFSLACVQSA